MAIIGSNSGDRDIFLAPEFKADVSWKLFVFCLIGFGIVSFAYIGLEFGYKKFLDNSITTLRSGIEEKPAFGPDSEKNIVAFSSQITNIRKLLNSHIFPSAVLKFMQSATHPKVAYSSASFSSASNQLALEAITDKYETIVRQIEAYNRYDEVQGVTLGASSYDNGSTKFSVKINFKPGFNLFKSLK